MRRQITIAIALIIVVIFGDVSPRVEAGGVWATEITQLLNHVQLMQQYIQQVQMVQNNFLRYTNMLQNTRVLPNQMVGPVLQDLNQLARIVVGGQALAYSMSNLNALREYLPWVFASVQPQCLLPELCELVADITGHDF